MLVDPKVAELADTWLDEDDRVFGIHKDDRTYQQRDQRRQSLAEAIQKAIEDWCEDDATPPHRLS